MQNPFDENQSLVRPTFLTILCLLTFTWNAYKFYDSAKSAFTPEKVIAEKEQANEMTMDLLSKYMKDDDLEKVEESQAETLKIFENPKLLQTGGFATLISSLLLILGAIWMWGLRKKGFWVYIAGNIIGILTPFIVFGGQVGISMGIMSLIASAIFTGLYAMNLKFLS